MCLILFAWQQHPEYSLVIAANRDEYHARPSAAAHFWSDQPHILGGRDLQQGGTWLGVTRWGRFAAVTNYRDPNHVVTPAISRGWLVQEFLLGTESPSEYLCEVESCAERYNGFGLIVGNRGTIFRTLDGGQQWQRIRMVPQAPGKGISQVP